ncbi:superoxide dismutase family protein [Erythrobacteraceae bacterium CFH 75059]|uniref:superoxide dismutase family protein n=1 Tax=Qipengyuania thermophila TaxID=2509361 RepID=UPI0010205B7B|nr:superoxide dismutase family protein [Qipengyuania thermophila]TCD06836.1 superoxide dismutase family protein [Erythrobacteraceae bacterium CFH 75059]
MIRFAAPPALALLIAGCAALPPGGGSLGSADLRTSDGRNAGTATLVASGQGVALDVALMNVPAGTRAIHIHERGECTPPDFQSAGAHLNPEGRQHGLENPRGAHLGDLPNIEVRATGTTRARFPLPGSRESVLARIFDSSGAAVVVHQNADDNVTDPAGNAGGRIVCGVLRPS